MYKNKFAHFCEGIKCNPTPSTKASMVLLPLKTNDSFGATKKHIIYIFCSLACSDIKGLWRHLLLIIKSYECYSFHKFSITEKNNYGSHRGLNNESMKISHSLEDNIVTSFVARVWTVDSFNGCSVKEPISDRHCNSLVSNTRRIILVPSIFSL